MRSVDKTFVPANLGYIMGFSGNKPPVSVANKGKWMFADIARSEKLYDTKLVASPRFPVNTQAPQCLLRLMSEEDPERHEAAALEFFRANWELDTPVGTPEEIKAYVGHLWKGDEAKLDALLAKSQTKEYKAKLKEEAKTLVEESGAFGMPWILVTRKQDGRTEKFFGNDRWEHIAAFLEEPYKGPMADGSIAKL